MKHISIKMYNTLWRDALSTNQWNTLSCYREIVATILIGQMYYIQFNTLFISGT